MNDSTLNDARQIAMDCLLNYPKNANIDLLHDLAFIYAKLGMSDSATFYLDMIKESTSSINGQNELRCYWAMEIISHKSGDTAKSHYYSSLKNNISD